jgi:phage-related protein
MATINGLNCIFANQSSEEFGVKMGFIGSNNRDSNDEQWNLVQTKNVVQEIFNYHGKYSSEPLQFKLTFFNDDGSYIDADKQEDLKNWLIRDDFSWLVVDQEDLCDKEFRCTGLSVGLEDVGLRNAGLTVQMTCDCNHAWTGIRTKPYSSTTTASYQFINPAKFNKYIVYPQLTITPTSNGDITVKNNTTNRTMSILNCVTTETIYIDCRNEIIKSSNGRNLLDDFNKYFLELIQGNNSLTLTGAFTMKMEYRLPVRIGG